MARPIFQKLDPQGPMLAGVIAVLGALVLAGLASAYYMEHNGHVVTGMTNQIVWGMPHVFAVFLIVAASGALNLASLSSVFGREEYKPYARVSALLAIALLVGGLAVLVLDLGRPDRLIVAMTTYNFRSIFAWNIYLYTGFVVIVGAYLFTMMDRGVSRMAAVVAMAGTLAFVWRLILTTGTGSIFGFLSAREAYDSAIMAPLFIAASLLFGLAIAALVLAFAGRLAGKDLIGENMAGRFRGLLAIFALATLYFAAALFLTKLYMSKHYGVVGFLLRDGGVYTRVLWGGWIFIGTALPLAILAFGRRSAHVLAASVLFIAGGLAMMYALIIGGQAYPLELFPGMQVTSSFQDGSAEVYTATLPEVLLGIGGFALALLVTAIAVQVLPFLPSSAGGLQEHRAAGAPAN
jgi:molybdopterin-containing oxidoreductase family membrane subunit